MAIILLITTEDGEVTELPVLNKIILGRSSSSDYKISDSKMSGSHCSFNVNPKGQLIFTDLESTNGSFINNSRIQQTVVKMNDILKVGNTFIKIDEKRLSTSERMAIGLSTANPANDKTLPEMSKIDKDGKSVAEALAETPKKGVVLNKDIKSKKTASNWASAENVLEQEASSGETKFLKLEKKKK